MRVVCLGDVMVDVVAHLPGPLAVGSDTPAPVGLFGGGSAANTACWLASTGMPATLIGCVGDDALGRLAVAELQAAGVSAELTIDPARPTGTCIVLVSPDGERTMVPDAGANSALASPPRALLDGAHLHVSGYALLNADARPAALAALAAARDAGTSVSVDAASAAPLAAAGGGEFLSWACRCPNVLLFANADEARVLSGLAEPRAAGAALAARCGEAVVKCGADGAVWAGAGGATLVPARRVAVVVDTTGAGDAFAAGFLAARHLRLDPLACVARGHELAAQAVAQPGARPAIFAPP